MKDTATRLINPAAACPEWCSSDHLSDTLVPGPDGLWDALHVSAPVTVVTTEASHSYGTATAITVDTISYVCETPEQSRPRRLVIEATDSANGVDRIDLTARQALRLAEVLVQQAAEVLAEEFAGKTEAGR